MYSFFAAGVPQPKGSTKSFRHRHTGKIVTMQNNNDKLRSWELIVQLEAQKYIKSKMTAVIVYMQFVLPRPKIHYRSNGEVKERFFNLPHVVKPDGDKLARAVLDALTKAGVYNDDANVVGHSVWKQYGEKPGVLIRISEA